MRLLTSLGTLQALFAVSTGFLLSPHHKKDGLSQSLSTTLFLSAPVDSDFAKAVPAVGENMAEVVDPNVYNVPVEQAAELWTVSVSAENFLERKANIPYLDTTNSKDYFVDDVQVIVSRQGGLGLELLELAGGRNDDYGLTIIENVNGNAKKAGIVPGDSIASVQIKLGTSIDETEEVIDCQCRNFDTTIGLLTSIPPEIQSLQLNLKRIRRWPKINVVVEYPPSQVAPGVDNKERLELVGGENLRRALLNRGIVMQDPAAKRCDFCGQKCYVKVDMGMPLLSPMSTTEEKIMRYNPKCRVSCKAVVGYNMQEGELRLKVNLNEWTDKDKQDSSPFFSR